MPIDWRMLVEDVKLSSNWSVSNIESNQRLYSFLSWCFVSFLVCLFSRLGFNPPPLNYFKVGALNHLRVSFSQLPLVSRAYVKVFIYWCEYRSRVLSWNLFFNLFNITSSSVRVKWGQWLLSLCHPKKVFHVYVDSWKKFKYQYFLVDPRSCEPHSSLCVMLEDNPSSSWSPGSESNICGDIFQKYWI